MALIFFLALLGLWIGGVRGALIGGILGLLLGQLLPRLVRRGLSAVQSQFVESTFAVVGALCKADGVVSRDEIQFAEQLFVRFHLSEEQTRAAKEAFNRGKAEDFDLDGEVDRFLRVSRGNHALVLMFLRVQLLAVAADGEAHPAELEMLRRIARRLGLGESEIASLEAMLRAAAGEATAGSGSGPPPRGRIEDAYGTLGLSEGANDAEVKRVYRKLMRENHPDRLASKGLPDSMRELAEERAREINAAYELIKKVRGF
jgi:DnaJ like chaperone protein